MLFSINEKSKLLAPFSYIFIFVLLPDPAEGIPFFDVAVGLAWSNDSGGSMATGRVSDVRSKVMNQTKRNILLLQVWDWARG